MSLLPHRYLVALGSNLGDRLAFLRHAGRFVATQIGPVTAHAADYQTPPMGAADQPFINSALITTSALPPEVVLTKLLAIEAQLGRVRRERWGNRVIDLDILMWQQWQNGHWVTASWASSTLQIPHPHMLQRDFVLVPAAQIAGDWRHPEGPSLQEALIASGFTLSI